MGSWVLTLSAGRGWWLLWWVPYEAGELLSVMLYFTCCWTAQQHGDRGGEQRDCQSYPHGSELGHKPQGASACKTSLLLGEQAVSRVGDSVHVF